MSQAETATPPLSTPGSSSSQQVDAPTVRPSVNAETPPQPTAESALAAELTETKKQVDALRQQLSVLQAEKAEADNRAREREPNVSERSAAARAAADRQADLLAQVGQLQILLRERETDLVGQKHANTQLRETNKELDLRLAQAERDFKTLMERKGPSDEVERLRRQVAEANAQLTAARQEGKSAAEKLSTAQQETQTAQARILELEKGVEPGSGGSAEIALLKATVTELTTTKERLERELEASKPSGTAAVSSQETPVRARDDVAEMAALRAENISLRQAAAEANKLAEKNTQLTRDNQQLTSFMNGNRQDLDKAEARIAQLEKELMEATAVRTEGGEAMRKLRGELEEANRTVDKLGSDVAELTAANEKLGMDLDSAQKSTAAALAAQSQAVNAASTDSYRMEIGTLSAQIKQLEAQIEEERAGAAREVATLANQLQRTRETNRSLTEANRALVGVRDGEKSATKEEVTQLQTRIKELTTIGDELRRQGQVAADSLRVVSEERDDLKAQLVDARKVATALPGMADEKVALQERLEAVGTQLVQAQRDEEALQKANADLTRQLATSEEAAEKARVELAAIQAKAADAEKAADLHTTSVADLTAANTRLEQERSELRRLVESYRADIARLNQSVRASEQQRVDAERGGQQNIDALTAQLAQARRELEAARVTQTRFAENYAAQERERSATIAQLRSENGALTARLNQAQGTLDQIAAAARLGTPAATIAAGGPAPVVRTSPPAASPTGEMRLHTVAEGDSLSRISMRFYGTPNRWQEVYQANRDILQGSSALRVGQQLRIP